MAVVKLQIDVGAGPRTIEIDTKKMKLGFYDDLEEAQETNSFRPIMRAYGAMLGFTREEMRELTLQQFEDIANAIKESASAAKIPNA